MDAIAAYLKEIEKNLQRGNATEHTHRPALKKLIEAISPKHTATNEPTREACGAPDYSVSTDTRHGPLTTGYIEAKDVGVDLPETERGEQLARYRKGLPNLILTDYLDFRWYIGGQLRSQARLATPGKGSKLTEEKGGAAAVRAIIDGFLEQSPESISTPKDLAERLARLTHIIRDIVIAAFAQKRASRTLVDLRSAFAHTLIPDLDEPENTPQFADMYAQTIAYGLFAARCNHSGASAFVREKAAEEIPKTNPFLRELFETITGSKMNDEPYAGIVDDLVSLLDRTDIGEVLAHFGARTRRQDPVVHFYETFLAAYDPKLRESRGVYYTPEPVVSYIVRSVDWLLREKFNLPDGLADTSKTKYTVERENAKTGKKEKSERTAPKVLILDPACGTATFLYAVIDHIRERFIASDDGGKWSAFIRDHLLPRMLGFELLMAPYAVAHLKLGMQLGAIDLKPALRAKWGYDFKSDDRLGVYLTNSLEQADREIQALLGPFRVLTEEANAARAIKRDLPIMVVLGNPPYSGHSANKGDWIRSLIETYKTGCPELFKPAQAKWLSDDYVKFIRFAQWRIQQTGSGVLAFITNHSYLDNPTFRGMRRSLLETFDEGYILDLHGNLKKKEAAPDGSDDENVFDIQQGVAIALWTKHPAGANRKPTALYHADLWGKRDHKYAVLGSSDASVTKWTRLAPNEPQFLFVPQEEELRKEYEVFPSIGEVFSVNGDPAPGMVTTHDEFAISWTAEEAIEKVERLLATKTEDEARGLFTLCSTTQWSYQRATKDLADGRWRNQVVSVLYRPFDVRFTVYDRNVAVHRRERVNDHMLSGSNLAITVGKAGQVIGPGEWNIVIATSHPTEFNLFRRGGNCIFPRRLVDETGANRAEADARTQLLLHANADGESNVPEDWLDDLNHGLT